MPRILLVEDNELNRDMLSRRLRRHGFEVRVAADGWQSLELVSAWRPDLVLMDMNLPGISGCEATRRLKRDPTTRSIPVIALTAHAFPEDEALARAAGCDGFDTKPIELPRLLRRIRDLLPPAGPPPDGPAPA